MIRPVSFLSYALLLLLTVSTQAWGQAASDPTPLEFTDAAEETRFQGLTHRLRCVMCQNQSLADSNAPIAHDLRREVLDLIRSGRTDAQVESYLVERYGEFVLYQPRVQRQTWLLWFGPIVLLLLGALVIFFIVRKNTRRLDNTAEDTPQEW